YTSTPTPRDLHPFPTRRSSDLRVHRAQDRQEAAGRRDANAPAPSTGAEQAAGTFEKGCVPQLKRRTLSLEASEQHNDRHPNGPRSEEHTSELQSRENLVCRLLL